MFGKKTANGYSEEKDLQLLMQAMDGVIGGNYEDIDTSAFQSRHTQISHHICGKSLQAKMPSLFVRSTVIICQEMQSLT